MKGIILKGKKILKKINFTKGLYPIDFPEKVKKVVLEVWPNTETNIPYINI